MTSAVSFDQTYSYKLGNVALGLSAGLGILAVKKQMWGLASAAAGLAAVGTYLKGESTLCMGSVCLLASTEIIRNRALQQKALTALSTLSGVFQAARAAERLATLKALSGNDGQIDVFGLWLLSLQNLCSSES